MVVDSAPGQPFEAHFADLNNDGKPEILASAFDTRYIGLDTRYIGLDTRYLGLDTRYIGLDTRYKGLDTRYIL